jgi:hypothetical protein
VYPVHEKYSGDRIFIRHTADTVVTAKSQMYQKQEIWYRSTGSARACDLLQYFFFILVVPGKYSFSPGKKFLINRFS